VIALETLFVDLQVIASVAKNAAAMTIAKGMRGARIMGSAFLIVHNVIHPVIPPIAKHATGLVEFAWAVRLAKSVETAIASST
jgi:hypothetical protein